MADEMTPLERVVAALTFDTPDRVPCATYFQSALQFIIRDDDYTWQEVLNHPTKLARAVEKQYTKYGMDNLYLPVDFRVDSEAFGGKCEYILKTGEGFRMPVVTEFAVNDVSEIDDLEVPDPKTAGRCPIILKAIEKLSEKYGNKVPIVGFINSPLDVATDIIKGHYSTVMPMIAKDPDSLHKLLQKITDFNKEFGNAMVEAGAHALSTVSGGFNHLTISPKQFAEFLTPYHTQLVKAYNVPYIFHQCQNATPFMDEISKTGCAAIAFHELVDLKWAKETYGKKHALAGNVAVSEGDSVMCAGTPDDVLEAAKKCIEIGKPGSGFLLSAGCEVHHAVREENIYALVKACKLYGKY
jgi:uroporphyrinogen decarboxylase